MTHIGPRPSVLRDMLEPCSVLPVRDASQGELIVVTEMDRIGLRVALTCPECGGAIWEMRDTVPLRYRCHTRHAFTASSLEALQGCTVEEALWAALRALHEQQELFLRLHRAARAGQDANRGNDAAREYLMKARQAEAHARLLRDLIGTGMHIALR